jgi:hypothetical protein
MPEHPLDPAELPESFRQLTLKQQKFVLQYLASNGNASEAARQAGYQASQPAVQGCENLRKPKIRAALADLLPLNGVTDARLLRKLSDLLDARKQSVKYDEKRGFWTYSKRLPDHPTQLSALDMALRIKAAYPREGQTPGSYTLIISQETAVDVQREPGQPASSPAGERHQRGHLTLEISGDP